MSVSLVARGRGKGVEVTRVPYLKPHSRVRVAVDDALGQEAGADGARDLARLECAFAVAHDEGRFADAL